MNLDYEDKKENFLNSLSEKKYCDIFNLRSRIETSEWERFSVKDLKRNMLSKKNKFPTTKNVLYTHIPFCLTRCDYCPYFTTPYRANLMEDYLDCLEKEIDNIKDTEYIKSTVFGSLYFGGGTPSILTVDNIKRIVTKIFNSFSFSKEGEFSFESNPSTLTEEKIVALKECGMNRVSLGIQTFNDKFLKEMKCAHTSQKAIEVINMLLDYGFIVNIDMIFGLVGQTKEDILEDVNVLNSLKKPHQVTFFPLRIATGTPLAEMLEEKEGITIKSHFDRLLEFDEFIEEKMKNKDYLREESPVFYHKIGAKAHEYHSTATRVVGIGASAGTLLDECESSNYRIVDEYMDAIKNNKSTALSGVPLTIEQAYERFILYQIIYMNRSIPNFKEIVAKNFYDYYKVPIGDLYDKVVQDMVRIHYIEKDTDRIRFTTRMWMILNKVKIGMPSII